MNRLPAIIRVFSQVGIETYCRSALGMRRARLLEKESEKTRVRARERKGEGITVSIRNKATVSFVFV